MRVYQVVSILAGGSFRAKDNCLVSRSYLMGLGPRPLCGGHQSIQKEWWRKRGNWMRESRE